MIDLIGDAIILLIGFILGYKFRTYTYNYVKKYGEF